MAVNEIHVAAPPGRVWEVLADPYAYRSWVVGTKVVRGADEGFPAEGTRLYHRAGAGPLTVADSTTVIRSDAPRLLILEAGLGPAGRARVEVELRASGDGTHVVLRETAAGGPARLLLPAGDLILRGRNRWSLERLRELAEAGG